MHEVLAHVYEASLAVLGLEALLPFPDFVAHHADKVEYGA